MAGIGPPKQPEAIIKAKGYGHPAHLGPGNVSKRLRFLESAPEPPKILDEVGAKLWTAVLMEATQIPGYISGFDLPAFEQYCFHYQLIRLANENIKKYGQVIKENGETKINPFFKTLQDSTKIFINLSDRFGFTPSMRTRIRMEMENEHDPLNDLEI